MARRKRRVGRLKRIPLSGIDHSMALEWAISDQPKQRAIHVDYCTPVLVSECTYSTNRTICMPFRVWIVQIVRLCKRMLCILSCERLECVLASVYKFNYRKVIRYWFDYCKFFIGNAQIFVRSRDKLITLWIVVSFSFCALCTRSRSVILINRKTVSSPVKNGRTKKGRARNRVLDLNTDENIRFHSGIS